MTQPSGGAPSTREAPAPSTAPSSTALPTPSLPPAPRGAFSGFSALKIRAYQFYTISALLQGMAESMTMLANGWYAYQLTGSTAILGLTLLAQAIPLTLFSFVGGIFADRFNRRTVWMVCVLLTGVLSLWLAVAVVMDAIKWQDLVVRAFFFGLILAFRMPARQGLMSDIVGREHIMSAVALQTLSNNSMQFIGPAVAGLVIATLGIGNAYFIITAFLFLAALAQLFINSGDRDTAKAKVANKEPFFTSAREGFKYLGRTPDVRAVLLFTLLSSALAMPFTQLLPAYGKQVMDLGPAKLGVLTSLAGMGSLAGAMIIAMFRPKKRGLSFIVSSLFWGIALTGFCATGNFAIAGAMSVLVGVGQAYNGTLGFGLLNAYTDRDYLGRVLSIQLMQFGLGTLAGFLVAIVAEAIGVRTAMMATSIGLAVASLACWTWARRLRGLA